MKYTIFQNSMQGENAWISFHAVVSKLLGNRSGSYFKPFVDALMNNLRLLGSNTSKDNLYFKLAH